MIFSLGMTDAHPSRTLLDVGTVIDDEPFLAATSRIPGEMQVPWVRYGIDQFQSLQQRQHMWKPTQDANLNAPKDVIW